MRGGQIGVVNVGLSTFSTEIGNFKEMKSLFEELLGLGEQLDQFLGPNLYMRTELILISILNILFSGEEEEMIKRAAMLALEIANPPQPGEATAEQKFPNEDPR